MLTEAVINLVDIHDRLVTSLVYCAISHWYYTSSSCGLSILPCLFTGNITSLKKSKHGRNAGWSLPLFENSGWSVDHPAPALPRAWPCYPAVPYGTVVLGRCVDSRCQTSIKPHSFDRDGRVNSVNVHRCRHVLKLHFKTCQLCQWVGQHRGCQT